MNNINSRSSSPLIDNDYMQRDMNAGQEFDPMAILNKSAQDNINAYFAQADFIREMNTQFGATPAYLSKLKACILNYSENLSFTNVIPRVCNAILSIFGFSEWQQTVAALQKTAIESAKYTDAYPATTQDKEAFDKTAKVAIELILTTTVGAVNLFEEMRKPVFSLVQSTMAVAAAAADDGHVSTPAELTTTQILKAKTALSDAYVCTLDYSENLSFSNLIPRIWNAILSIIGFSQWQVAVDNLKNEAVSIAKRLKMYPTTAKEQIAFNKAAKSVIEFGMTTSVNLNCAFDKSKRNIQKLGFSYALAQIV